MMPKLWSEQLSNSSLTRGTLTGMHNLKALVAFLDLQHWLLMMTRRQALMCTTERSGCLQVGFKLMKVEFVLITGNLHNLSVVYVLIYRHSVILIYASAAGLIPLQVEFHGYPDPLRVRVSAELG
jgi:hypothetical protein